MDLKLTFLGRVASRWRVRVEIPMGVQPRGLTIGLWGEDGNPLGPAVVAPANTPRVWEAELAGPLQLPSGTQVRCMADLDGCAPWIAWLGVDRRRGLHAFLHADGRLPVVSTCTGSALGKTEVRRLAQAFAWIAPAPTAGAPCRSTPCDLGAELGPELAAELGAEGVDLAADLGADPAAESLPPGLREMLAEEFGVDVDDLDEETLDFMKG